MMRLSRKIRLERRSLTGVDVGGGEDQGVEEEEVVVGSEAEEVGVGEEDSRIGYRRREGGNVVSKSRHGHVREHGIWLSQERSGHFW